jgi:hypothetical protein
VKWAPLAAFALFVAVALAWLARDPSVRRRTYPSGSSLELGPSGASLARAYLKEIGRDPSSLAVPLAQAVLSPETVLLRLDIGAGRDQEPVPMEVAPDAGPPAPRQPESGLSEAEDGFVRAGGRLVLAIRGERESGAVAVRGQRVGPRKVSPLIPGVRDLRPEAPRTLPASALVDAQPVFEHGESPSVARRALGKGEVWWLAEPEILLNEKLGEGDHLALLLALCAGRVPVFDESAHGLGTDTGPLDLLRRWGFGPALLLGACAALAGFWRRARTVGPPADPYSDPRSESVELVDSLAALYRRALKPAEAVELYRSRVVREVALTLGIPEKRAEAVLAERAPGLEEAHGPGERLSILAHACERFRDEHRRRR